MQIFANFIIAILYKFLCLNRPFLFFEIINIKNFISIYAQFGFKYLFLITQQQNQNKQLNGR